MYFFLTHSTLDLIMSGELVGGGRTGCRIDIFQAGEQVYIIHNSGDSGWDRERGLGIHRREVLDSGAEIS